MGIIRDLLFMLVLLGSGLGLVAGGVYFAWDSVFGETAIGKFIVSLADEPSVEPAEESSGDDTVVADDQVAAYAPESRSTNTKERRLSGKQITDLLGELGGQRRNDETREEVARVMEEARQALAAAVANTIGSADMPCNRDSDELVATVEGLLGRAVSCAENQANLGLGTVVIEALVSPAGEVGLTAQVDASMSGKRPRLSKRFKRCVRRLKPRADLGPSSGGSCSLSAQLDTGN